MKHSSSRSTLTTTQLVSEVPRNGVSRRTHFPDNLGSDSMTLGKCKYQSPASRQTVADRVHRYPRKNIAKPVTLRALGGGWGFCCQATKQNAFMEENTYKIACTRYVNRSTCMKGNANTGRWWTIRYKLQNQNDTREIIHGMLRTPEKTKKKQKPNKIVYVKQKQ